MKSILSFSVMLSVSFSASAAPLEQAILIKPHDGLKLIEGTMTSKLSNAGLYLCDHAGFTGHCIHYATPLGQCVTIIDQFPRGKGVKSAVADQGNWCTLYS
ncbi:hypothetical protein AJ78_00266 [Emergomyces pasteurianus Ep9510]|uniref:Uncharacterized protein n=1 Tax=Emergomyces pasteurianus Ep9510 TaxID=1447872 RepID=A0A1J9QU92_9EURO|nr:hypothetical protein AJ78_00266 [Emergomyces pasteurianus Ep9510]